MEEQKDHGEQSVPEASESTVPAAMQQDVHAAAMRLEWAAKSPEDALVCGLHLEGQPFPVAEEFESPHWKAARQGCANPLQAIQKARNLGVLTGTDICRYVLFKLSLDYVRLPDDGFIVRFLTAANVGSPEVLQYFADRVPPPAPPRENPLPEEKEGDDDYDEDYDDEEEDDDEEMKRVDLSQSTPMRDVWQAVSDVLSSYDFKHLDDDIFHHFDADSAALMDSRSLDISVREFCAQYDVPLQTLTDLLPVHFID